MNQQQIITLGSLGILSVILACTIPSQHAEAANSINAIGITIEKSCSLSSKCVKYSDIKDFDNSPKTIGHLVTKENITKRISAPIQNNLEWLRYSNLDLVIIDPPSKIAGKIKMITIVSKLDAFIQPDQYVVQGYTNVTGMKPQDSIRQYTHDWKVDSGCNTAIIAGSNWKVLLPAMIKHLQSGCTFKMPYDNIVKDIKPLTKHDISTSYKSKFDKWVDEIKQCSKIKNGCANLKQPTRAGLKP